MAHGAPVAGMSLGRTPRFVLPGRDTVARAAGGESSYALYNYYGWGLVAAAKRRRFQRALRLGSSVAARRAIDMGCADGVLLPSLAQLYEHVAAIDVNQHFTARAQRLVDATNLKDVQVVCSKGLTFDQVRARIGGGYQVMYLLETLEHVGRQPDMWESKMKFLRQCFTLLEAEGRIVISVPKMVGIAMLAKNLTQRCLHLQRDALTWKQVLKSAVLKDTDDLEPLWTGHHVGFNHLKLDDHLRRCFTLHQREESAISVFYLLGR